MKEAGRYSEKVLVWLTRRNKDAAYVCGGEGRGRILAAAAAAWGIRGNASFAADADRRKAMSRTPDTG